KLEIEDVDVLGQPFEPRGAGDCRYTLLYQPAQADLCRALAVIPADPRKDRVVPYPAPGDGAVGDQRHVVFGAGLPHLGLVEIGMVFDLVTRQRLRTIPHRL